VESHERTRELAYRLWQQRGCPYGSPEVDWFRAEKQLLGTTADDAAPTLIMIARVLGSAIGIVARFVMSLK